MSAKNPKPELFQQILDDLDAIAGTREGRERRVYQVGFLAAVLTRILLEDRWLRRAWHNRIDAIKQRNNDQA